MSIGDDDPVLQRLFGELERGRTRSHYFPLVVRESTDAAVAVRAMAAWAGRRNEPIVRPRDRPVDRGHLHRHLLMLVLDDEDRRGVERWLRAAAAESPRGHRVVEVQVEALGDMRRRHALRYQRIDVSVVRRLIDDGEFAQADAWVSVGEVLARVARSDIPGDLRLATGWLRFWQGRFEEAMQRSAGE